MFCEAVNMLFIIRGTYNSMNLFKLCNPFSLFFRQYGTGLRIVQMSLLGYKDNPHLNFQVISLVLLNDWACQAGTSLAYRLQNIDRLTYGQIM